MSQLVSWKSARLQRGCIAIACSLVLSPRAARAQEQPDTFLLPEVVVTAARLRTPIAVAPGTVTVLNGAELRARGVRHVADALRVVPGVAVAQGGGPGGLTSVFMRGGESDYVQVLVDGIQVNDPGGAYDWAHLRVEDVERIEIVRGPASVLYGSDAVAGVVQIFTRAGGAPRVEGGVSVTRGRRPGSDGSFDAGALDVSLTGRTRAPLARGAVLRYGVTAAQLNSDGLYPYNSDYDNQALSVRLQLVAARSDAAVTARRSRREHHYPTSGSGALVDSNQFARGDELTLGLDAGHRVWSPVELRVLATLHDTDVRTENPPENAVEAESFWSTSEQQRRGIDARANIDVARATTLSLGVEREWQRATTAFESLSGFGTFADSSDDRRANTGWYGQVHTTRVRSFAATVGGRIDDNQRFGTFRTGRVAASWHPFPVARVHAAFGTAFKEPTLFENFATGFARGNPDLQPERARSWEAGAEYAPHRDIAITATWFHQRFRNLIQYTFNTPTPEAPNYFNVGGARARGVELSARAAVAALTAAVNYTWTRTRVTAGGFGEDPAFVTGGPLLRRPRHQANATTTLRLLPSLRAHVDAHITGSRVDLDFTDPAQFAGVRIELPRYTSVDAALIYTAPLAGWNAEVTLFARNLLNERYEQIYNFPSARRVLGVGLRTGVGL